jgi:hypothetical protein
MARQVFQNRSPIRRSILGAARVLAFVAAGGLAVVLISAAVAPSGGPLDLSPFVVVPAPTPAIDGSAAPIATPAPPAIVTVLNGAGQAIGNAVAAITAPFSPTATSTPSPTATPTTTPNPTATAPTPRPTARGGGQPSTLPSHTAPPHP